MQFTFFAFHCLPKMGSPYVGVFGILNASRQSIDHGSEHALYTAVHFKVESYLHHILLCLSGPTFALSIDEIPRSLANGERVEVLQAPYSQNIDEFARVNL